MQENQRPSVANSPRSHHKNSTGHQNNLSNSYFELNEPRKNTTMKSNQRYNHDEPSYEASPNRNQKDTLISISPETQKIILQNQSKMAEVKT
jgi:hypothetical protein